MEGCNEDPFSGLKIFMTDYWTSAPQYQLISAQYQLCKPRLNFHQPGSVRVKTANFLEDHYHYGKMVQELLNFYKLKVGRRSMVQYL